MRTLAPFLCAGRPVPLRCPLPPVRLAAFAGQKGKTGMPQAHGATSNNLINIQCVTEIIRIGTLIAFNEEVPPIRSREQGWPGGGGRETEAEREIRRWRFR